MTCRVEDGSRAGEAPPDLPPPVAPEPAAPPAPPAPPGPRSASRRSRVLAYLLPATLTAAVVAAWFEPGAFYARGDVVPFERRAVAGEVLSLWGHQFTSAGSPSYEMARLPEIAALRLADLVGAPATAAQRGFYTAMAFAVVATAVFLLFAVVRRPLAAGTTALLAFFNPFVLQHLPNPLYLWALSIMAVVGGLVLRWARGAGPPPVVLGVAAVPACYLALNPPLLAIVVLWSVGAVVLAGLAWGRPALLAALGRIVRATPWVVALNLWWTVPLGLALFGGGTASEFTAETSVLEWSWTHARNSLANVVSLSGHWGWVYPDFYPYAARLDALPTGPLKFALPLLAASAVVLAREARRLVGVLLAVAAALVVLGKGLHPPLAGVNRAVYELVPGMYLFRDPLAKFGPALLMVLVVLAAMVIDRSLRRGDRRAGPVVAVLVAAALVYPVPLWTGEVVTRPTQDFPSAHVRLPEGWRRVADHLNSSGHQGKVLVLPLGDYYQLPTRWGFYGADMIPRWLLDRPAIQPLNGGYRSDTAGFRTLVERVQQALLVGDVAEVPGLLAALGVSDVVLRHDLDLDFPGRRLVDPASLRPALDAAAGLERRLSTAVADVYAVGSPTPSRIYLASSVVAAGREEDVAGLLGTSPPGTVVRPAEGAAGGDMAGRVLRPPDTALVLDGGGPRTVKRNLVGGPVVEVSVSGAPPPGPGPQPSPRLVVRSADRLELPGAGAPEPPLGEVAVPASPDWAAAANGRILGLDGGAALASLPPGGRLSTFDTGRQGRLNGVFSEVGDCHARKRGDLASLGISAETLAGDAGSVRLTARENAACVALDVPALPAPSSLSEPTLYRLSFDYRTVAGRRPRFCLLQVGPGGCVTLPEPDRSDAWTTYDEVAFAEPSAEQLRLVLYADGAGGGDETVIEYRGVTLSAHPEHAHWVMPPEVPVAVELPPDGGALRLAPPRAPATPTLSPVSDCHRFDERPLEAVGIRATRLDGPDLGVRLEAREHSACVSLGTDAGVPDARHRISFRYRSVAGERPRICLYQVGPRRCAQLPPLEAEPGWHEFDGIAQPEVGTRRLLLYLYADGGTDGTTVVEYRDLTMERVPSFDVTVVPVAGDPPAPPLRWRSRGPAAYEVRVPASRQPRTVVLAESYSTGWRASTGSGLHVDHFRANGYGNAWVLPPGPATVLEVAYGPNRLALPLVVLAVAAACAAALLPVARRRRPSAPEAAP